MSITKVVRKKGFLTLLEVMIAIVIITLLSGVIFSSFRPLLQKRKFAADLSRLYERCLLLRALAIYEEKDFEIELISGDKNNIFSGYEEIKALELSPFSIYFNDQKVDRLKISFLSSGEVFPQSGIKVSLGSDTKTLNFLNL